MTLSHFDRPIGFAKPQAKASSPLAKGPHVPPASEEAKRSSFKPATEGSKAGEPKAKASNQKPPPPRSESPPKSSVSRAVSSKQGAPASPTGGVNFSKPPILKASPVANQTGTARSTPPPPSKAETGSVPKVHVKKENPSPPKPSHSPMDAKNSPAPGPSKSEANVPQGGGQNEQPVPSKSPLPASATEGTSANDSNAPRVGWEGWVAVAPLTRTASVGMLAPVKEEGEADGEGEGAGEKSASLGLAALEGGALGQNSRHHVVPVMEAIAAPPPSRALEGNETEASALEGNLVVGNSSRSLQEVGGGFVAEIQDEVRKGEREVPIDESQGAANGGGTANSADGELTSAGQQKSANGHIGGHGISGVRAEFGVTEAEKGSGGEGRRAEKQETSDDGCGATNDGAANFLTGASSSTPLARAESVGVAIGEDVVEQEAGGHAANGCEPQTDDVGPADGIGAVSREVVILGGDDNRDGIDAAEKHFDVVSDASDELLDDEVASREEGALITEHHSGADIVRTSLDTARGINLARDNAQVAEEEDRGETDSASEKEGVPEAGGATVADVSESSEREAADAGGCGDAVIAADGTVLEEKQPAVVPNESGVIDFNPAASKVDFTQDAPTSLFATGGDQNDGDNDKRTESASGAEGVDVGEEAGQGESGAGPEEIDRLVAGGSDLSGGHASSEPGGSGSDGDLNSGNAANTGDHGADTDNGGGDVVTDGDTRTESALGAEGGDGGEEAGQGESGAGPEEIDHLVAGGSDLSGGHASSEPGGSGSDGDLNSGNAANTGDHGADTSKCEEEADSIGKHSHHLDVPAAPLLDANDSLTDDVTELRLENAPSHVDQPDGDEEDKSAPVLSSALEPDDSSSHDDVENRNAPERVAREAGDTQQAPLESEAGDIE